MKELIPDEKVYVRVNADFNEDGKLIPLSIIWEDGRTFLIDTVTKVRPAFTGKVQTNSDRYTVMIDDKWAYLYFERNEQRHDLMLGRWYVKRKCA